MASAFDDYDEAVGLFPLGFCFFPVMCYTCSPVPCVLIAVLKLSGSVHRDTYVSRTLMIMPLINPFLLHGFPTEKWVRDQHRDDILACGAHLPHIK